MKKWVLLSIILALSLFGVYYYINHDFRNSVQNKKPDFELSSKDLFLEFDRDDDQAHSKYLGKTLSISGVIASVSQEGDRITISLETEDMMSAVVCELNVSLAPKNLSVKEGDPIKIKGECSGKLIDIILVNSVIVN